MPPYTVIHGENGIFDFGLFDSFLIAGAFLRLYYNIRPPLYEGGYFVMYTNELLFVDSSDNIINGRAIIIC